MQGKSGHGSCLGVMTLKYSGVEWPNCKEPQVNTVGQSFLQVCLDGSYYTITKVA